MVEFKWLEHKLEQEMHFPVIQVGFNDTGIFIHIVRSPHYSEDILIPEENATSLCQMFLQKQVEKRKEIISTLRNSSKSDIEQIAEQTAKNAHLFKGMKNV